MAIRTLSKLVATVAHYIREIASGLYAGYAWSVAYISVGTIIHREIGWFRYAASMLVKR